MNCLPIQAASGAGCWRLLVFFGWMATASLLRAEEKLEFEPDPYTLLLLHCNDNTQFADYSAGWNRLCGMGARLTDGYYGKGINLTFPQFNKDFLKSGDDYTPRFMGWGFQPKGILDYRQGAFEFWFKLPPENVKNFPLTTAMLEGVLARNVFDPEQKYYNSFFFDINAYGCKYWLPFVSGECATGKLQFADIQGFERNLDREKWHHFALCWSAGEVIAYLDGRPLISHDMTGKHGLAIVSNAGYYLFISNIILDELRVSKNVRYQEAFEPRWRDGQRPEYAFPGNPDVKCHPTNHEAPYVPAGVDAKSSGKPVRAKVGELRFMFDQQTGYLKEFGSGKEAATAGQGQQNGLLLWEGAAREWLPASNAKDWKIEPDAAAFQQNFGDRVTVDHHLRKQDGAVAWEVTLENHSDREVWLEYLLSLPVPIKPVGEFFDGSERQTKLPFSRRREAYDSTLPFVAAAGNGASYGVGMDPHLALNDLASEWIPEPSRGGIIRQGSRVALFPGEQFKCTFFVLRDCDDFGALNAISAYHQLAPDLYQMRPDVPVYSYLPANADLAAFFPFPDQARLCYIGGLWGHGPGHCDGDEFGVPEWWGNPKFDADPSYAYVRRLEAQYKGLPGLRQNIVDYYRSPFDNYYPVMRRHCCPDLMPPFIARELWPDYKVNDDALGMGQYYHHVTSCWIVNEYNNPFGRFFMDSLKRYSRSIAAYSPGWINDMSYIPNLRFNDPIAKKTNGRSFSADLGTFVRGAMGRVARYEVANHFMDNGHRMSFWSDGGWYSYSLSAYSAANAIEGDEKYRGIFTLEPSVTAGRYLCGEKPFTILASSFDDWIGTFHTPEDFKGGSAPMGRFLRDYYRYCDDQLTLHALKQGITFSCLYVMGHQTAMERMPLIVESTVLGRKLVPAARVAEPLWVRRAGEGMASLIVAGNEKAESRTTDIELLNRYFGGAPLFGAYYGGEVRHELKGETVRIKNVALAPRSAAAFKILGILSAGHAQSVRTQFSGNGLTMNIRMEIESEDQGELTLNPFAPLYTVKQLTVNGEGMETTAPTPLKLKKGKNVVEAVYANAALQFSKEDWEAVDLIKNGQTNFCVATDPGATSVDGYPLGFERGTAMFLNDFLFQYDEEDGVLDNLKPARFIAKPAGPGNPPVVTRPSDFTGWLVVMAERPLEGLDAAPMPLPEPQAPGGRVRIDRATKTIFIEGRTQGDLRRAMVVFMRLVDRKYPHIGRFMGLRGFYAQPFFKDGKIQWDVWRPRDPFRKFFEAIDDKEWVIKPLLREEYEGLYANGNLDFAGKYQLKVAPYIFEPTYADNFVYGYCGWGRAETDQALKQTIKNPGK
ncbi:MAG: hypothetical protein HY360_11710 [Verrucomicrobia bacterium]|nr:hypothetical protein [Verrucomicrobiota bacterium]